MQSATADPVHRFAPIKKDYHKTSIGDDVSPAVKRLKF
jgi:hypothetical protein